ncbi:IS5 family transposase domain protein [Candidatus Cyrtobacter comes]|uniref:IS5 family transposase domain protein n=1 Tax=Candidatus Cyrtobacter comes TaxID=675776 RepID=A0ABU5L8P9_9RICK|nr:IS5 family transposase domain protein [Candidatus Cyrtobacter comes]
MSYLKNPKSAHILKSRLLQILDIKAYKSYKSELPRNKMVLTKEEKKKNQELVSERVTNGNVIGILKRLKIIADKYRNRRKRFGLRFNLIAGICNLELSL